MKNMGLTGLLTLSMAVIVILQTYIVQGRETAIIDWRTTPDVAVNDPELTGKEGVGPVVVSSSNDAGKNLIPSVQRLLDSFKASPSTNFHDTNNGYYYGYAMGYFSVTNRKDTAKARKCYMKYLGTGNVLTHQYKKPLKDGYRKGRKAARKGNDYNGNYAYSRD